MAAVLVNVDNFERAETDRMLASMLRDRGVSVNELGHIREPTRIDQQTVIPMNRDTLYSMVVANISEGATPAGATWITTGPGRSRPSSRLSDDFPRLNVSPLVNRVRPTRELSTHWRR